MITWLLFIPAAVLAAVLDQGAAQWLGGAGPFFCVLLAFAAASFTSGGEALAAWWVAGMARDILSGSRLGEAALPMLLWGMLAVCLWDVLRERDRFFSFFLVAGGAVCVRLAQPLWSLEGWEMSDVRNALANACLAAAFCQPAIWVVELMEISGLPMEMRQRLRWHGRG